MLVFSSSRHSDERYICGFWRWSGIGCCNSTVDVKHHMLGLLICWRATKVYCKVGGETHLGHLALSRHWLLQLCRGGSAGCWLTQGNAQRCCHHCLWKRHYGRHLSWLQAKVCRHLRHDRNRAEALGVRVQVQTFDRASANRHRNRSMQAKGQTGHFAGNLATAFFWKHHA